MKNTREKGKDGEDIALAYLRKKGYQIRHTNWQFSHKEIDIVAMDGEGLVIVEVKMRESDFFENPEDAVTPQKIRFLLDAAEAYQEAYNLSNEIRFDVVAIINWGGGKVDIEHFVDAFESPIM